MDPAQESQKILDRVEALEKQVARINARNLRVETDKSWETSSMRIGFITIVTYLCTAIIFWLIGVEHYFRNACIPTVGYFLSAQSLTLLRKWWFQSQN